MKRPLEVQIRKLLPLKNCQISLIFPSHYAFLSLLFLFLHALTNFRVTIVFVVISIKKANVFFEKTKSLFL